MKYPESVAKYFREVHAGTTKVSAKNKAAIERFKSDYKRQDTEGFPYHFDELKAEQAIDFVELMPAKNGEQMTLEPFQRWIIAELFGWRCSDGTRRYRQAFISMARKNSKSFLMSRLGAIYLLMETQPAMSREIIFVANTSKQAHLSFDLMKSGLLKLTQVSPVVRRRLILNRDEVTDKPTQSHALTLATNLNSIDGYQSDLAIVDEYAEAKTDDLMRVLKSGQVNSENALLAVISTCGNDLSSPMKHEYDFVSKVLNGEVQADRYFIAIWEQDKRAEVYHADKWEKSNPLLHNAERAKVMRPALQSDVDQYSAQGNMLPLYIRNFNMWYQQNSASYISDSDWAKAECQDLPELTGDIFIGVDLSKSTDLTSVSWVLPTTAGGHYVDSHSFIGTKWGLDTKIKRDRFDYRASAERGECSITELETGLIDYNKVLSFIEGLASGYNLQGIYYDPWHFSYLLQEFSDRDYPLIEVRQGQRTLSMPTLTFRDKVFSNEIQHPHNELLGYSINNAILKYDTNNNPIIDKTKESNKIDPVDALLNAWTGIAIADNDKKESANNDFYTSEEFSF